MGRSFGEIELIHDVLPDWAAYVLAALTQLGDQWFLFLLLTLLLFAKIERHERIAVVGGLWLAGAGMTYLLKYSIAAPRPDLPLLDPLDVATGIRPLYEATALAGGYGLPSGHAMSAAIVYLGLAWALQAGTRRQRYLIGSTLVVLISFTRIGLGVHYLVDVIAGVILALSLWAVWFVLSRWESFDGPTWAFGLAILANLVFVTYSMGYFRGVVALALSVGGLVWWHRHGR